ncbi:MAG: 50S ribosomal protein L11 [Candidatus Wildermuthbacteria bacterium]|nr:50S ribosomal protein L11 [Candidatus Wildermuthbacteria bacterium]
MAKKIKKIVRLHIQAGKATPAPPVGPVLAQYGLNIGEFCKNFNDATKEKAGFKLPVDVIIYEDRSYEFKTHEPPASALLLKVAGVEKGSGVPNKTKVGKISRSQLQEIVKQKMADLNADTPEAAARIIEGTAKNMGITIE